MIKTSILACLMASITLVPAPADAEGLSAKEKRQIKTIVQRQIAAVMGAMGSMGASGPQGPQGPQGGNGNGPRFIFATVEFNGHIDELSSFGITNANIRREDGGNITRYCFSGLPEVTGGQVSLLAGGRSAIRVIDLHISPIDPDDDCPVLVQTSGIDQDQNRIQEDTSFYILLYRR